MGRGRPAVPKETVDRIRELKRKGYRNTLIMEETGVSRTTVLRYTKGIEPKYEIRPMLNWSIEDIYYLIDFYPLQPVREIAEALGRSYRQVEDMKDRLIREGLLVSKGKGRHGGGEDE